MLLVAGTLVGASGTFLTLLMARAMGRSVANILFGALKGGSTLGAGVASDRPVKSANPEDVAIMLAYADRVIIVPGYGLAVAQAQHSLRELVDLLGERDIEVDYAIHPVAGRMPGHMNVLLAEAQVPYEQLKEMDDINGDFKDADVVLVVGANDVVNPAAKTTPGAPIYGMPILNADEAKQVVFMKRSMRPGFAGHRERAALRGEHHPALRRRQGLDGQAAQRRQGSLTSSSSLKPPRKPPLIGHPVTYWTREFGIRRPTTGGTVESESSTATSAWQAWRCSSAADRPITARAVRIAPAAARRLRLGLDRARASSTRRAWCRRCGPLAASPPGCC